MPTLPNVTSKFVFDYSDLTRAEKASARAHGQFASDAKSSTTHTLRFEQSLTTLLDHFGGMPPIVNQAGRSIESMASQGVTGMGLVGGAALVAVGAITEVVKGSMGAYQQIGDEVENFRRVTGASAEESSRLVHVFTDLGVNGDVASQGMFKLSKAIETAPKKLAEFGVEVARDAAGNVNLSKTLLSVADAYNATTDPAKRNLLLFDAFGKSGRDMIPILEQGSAALQQMESSASLLFSQADLDRLKEAKIHTQEVKSAWDEFWAASVGEPATEAQNNMAEAQLASIYANKKYADGLADGTIKANAYGPALGKLLSKYEEEYYASQKVREGLAAQTQATQDQAAADEALWTATDKLITQEEAQVNAGFALQRADLAVAESAGKADKAAEAYDKAVKQFGAGSDEAVAAHQAYEQSLIDQADAYYKDAAAARKLQEDTDLVVEGHKDAAKEAQVYIDKLQAEANTLSPDNPLRKNLQAYIDKLKNEIPSQVSTTILTVYATKGGRAQGGDIGLTGYADGGRPQVGVPAIFGEKGPELWVPDQPGTVIPHGQTAAAAASPVAAIPQNMQVTVEIPVILDGAEIGRITGRQVARLNQAGNTV